MKLFYITLNNTEQAKTISFELLQKQIAVCTNWFPIQCAYRWEGEIKEGAEVVLIVKAQNNSRVELEAVIATHIDLTHFIGELDVVSVNQSFLSWIDTELMIS